MTLVYDAIDLSSGRVSLSLAEFLSLPGSARAEIVDGVLRPMTREARRNRTVQLLLAMTLRAQAPPQLSVLQEEVVVLADDPAVARIPDVVVFRTSDADTGVANNTPAADVVLAVEILSPSTRSADLREKPAEYAAAAIPGFWRIELDPDISVTTHRLEAGRYVQAAVFTRGQIVRDPVLQWAAVDVTGLLANYA